MDMLETHFQTYMMAPTWDATLKDTLLALEWVQDNVEAFGGDVGFSVHLRVLTC